MKGVRNISTTSVTKSTHHAQGNSLLSGKTLGICIGLIAMVFVALAIFKVSFGTLFFAEYYCSVRFCMSG